MQIPWPSTSTLVGPATSVSENVSLSQARGKRGKTFEKRDPQEYTRNLKKNSMIDGGKSCSKEHCCCIFSPAGTILVNKG